MLVHHWLVVLVLTHVQLAGSKLCGFSVVKLDDIALRVPKRVLCVIRIVLILVRVVKVVGQSLQNSILLVIQLLNADFEPSTKSATNNTDSIPT